MKYDVLIIGGGAAGLMAAASAAGRGLKTILLEKNRKLGVKILMSGGTRCNITHDCSASGIVRAFGRNGKFLHSALAALSPGEVVAKIESQGVATKIESTGKIFPVSDKAIDVRDALVSLAETSGANLVAGCAVTDIDLQEGEFQINTDQGMFGSQSVVITTGGKSYPGCGTTGDGYGWAAKFGHSIVEPVPALTPILSTCDWAHDLKGVTIDPVGVRVEDPEKKKKKKVVAEQTGSFLFTHWGFSGPAVLDVSREVARYRGNGKLELVCNFWPAATADELIAELNESKINDGRQIAGKWLANRFPRRLVDALIAAAGLEPSIRLAELSRKSMLAIVGQVTSCRFPINGTLGFEKAEVTAGGVSLREVDSKTMMSKLQPGLFLAGEVLDLDGQIGGFNFQSAFSTGWLAGQWVNR